MELIVPDDKLSLAIGKKGQNVRLASQLTGWKLDIISETRVKEMREFANQSLGALPGMTEMLIELLYAHGFRQAKDVAEANPEVLAQIPGRRRRRGSRRCRRQAKKQIGRRRAASSRGSSRSARRPAPPRPAATPTSFASRSGCCASAAWARRRSSSWSLAGYNTRRGRARTSRT